MTMMYIGIGALRAPPKASWMIELSVRQWRNYAWKILREP